MSWTTHCEATNKSQAAVKAGIGFLNSLQQIPVDYNNPVERVQDPFDINNLRYHEPIHIEEQKKKINLTPKVVEEFIEKMNNLEDSDKLFVIGIGTGGTISMSPTGPNNSLEPDLHFDAIMDKSDARLKDDFEILWLDAYATDSSQLEVDDVGDMAISMSYIWKKMKPEIRKRFAGFFIVHGTDTMPKSWNHLEMMLGQNMPFNVVHTGAQKTINVKINDAQTNVKEGLYTLKMLYKNNCAESLTVMGWVALLTTGMTKVSDHNAKAMNTYMHKYAIDFSDLPDPDNFTLPNWLRTSPGTKRFNPIVYRGPNRIQELPDEMQEDPRAIIAITRLAAAKALLLVTYGANTYDISAMKRIGEEAKKQDILAYAVSPVNADPKLDVYAAAEEMIKSGVTPLYMTKEAARAKLMLAFAKFQDNIWDTAEFLTTNFLWEIPTKETKRSV